MTSKFLLTAAAGLAALALAVTPAPAADFMKSVTTTDAFSIQGMDQAARSDTSVVWMAPDMVAMVATSGEKFILRNDRGEMYFIDNNAKTYVKVPVDFMAKLKSDMPDTAQAQMQSLFDNLDITVDATDSSKKIGDWNTRLYNITLVMPMGTVRTQSWNTTDIDIDLAMYNSVANAMMASMPGFEKMLEKLLQLKGAPVEAIQTMSIGGAEVKSTTRLLEYAKKDAPAGMFEVPEGYTLDANGMGGMMGGH